jgi:pullulanase
MSIRQTLSILIVFLIVAALHAATSPRRQTPAFLDAPNQVTIWMDEPMDATSLRNQVSVICGGEVIPVTQIKLVADTSNPTPIQPGDVVLVGTFQSALGGANWNTNDPQTKMQEVRAGVYELQIRLPKGTYQYKVTQGGTWAVNYGVGLKPNGPNISVNVPANDTPVLFRVDFNQNTLQTSLDTPVLKPSSMVQALPETSHVLRLTLGQSLGPLQITQPMSVRFADGTSRPIFARDVLSDPEYFYHGDDLGATYSPGQTTFKVWSPVSSQAELLLYPNAKGSKSRSVALKPSPFGVWSVTVPGDLNGVFYQYQFISYGVQRTAPDIYGHAASADLRRSMVVDLSRTNPADWESISAPTLDAPTDAVVYELHMRDFTSDPSSGVPNALQGKYLGLIAPNTHVPGTDSPTGLDYLKQLGVTHIHILPFQSINPQHAGGYNWGYETDLFDVPEPRYATHPNDPAGVIRQVKTMIVGLHRAHLGLVMDIVYNHTVPVSGDTSPFWATVPYYYFRTGPQGELLNESGVGNALDDDHPMVRNYICDSLAYWATQYHVDGFRFDLLGMFTPATVSAISQTLHRIRPDILLYGEPWTGGGPVRFDKGDQRGLGMAVFNDNFRNLIRGDLNGTKSGFALGGGADETALETAMSGSPDFTQAPTETMNYVSIHDDMTLWDKITKTLPGNDSLDRQALKLAGAMVLLSQGVPILEGGAELGRTKEGNSNSYNLGDAVNQFDWKRGLAFADVSDYYRGLIAIRRTHPAFCCSTAAQVKNILTFLPVANLPPKTTAFTLDGAPIHDSWLKTLVVFHGANTIDPMTLPPGSWHLAVNGQQANIQGTRVSQKSMLLAPLSAYVFYQALD